MPPRSTTRSSNVSSPRTETLSPLDILLDPQNPRLSPEEQGSSQDELLSILLRRFKLVELGRSVAESGYVKFDPLVGLRKGDKVYVLEGNRRIAALQLLLKPGLAPARDQGTWRELADELGDKKKSLKSVQILTHASRDDADVSAYIGFRHVTSVLKWPALEKAAYIARLVEKQRWTYQEIAKRLGSRAAHIERHYVAYRIVVQAEEDAVDGSENMRSSFGVLLRALQAGGVSEFLGVNYPGEPKQSRRPIPPSKGEEFGDFVKWTFGAGDDEPVLEDSRQLTKWARILQSDKAKRYLKTTRAPRFDRAWQKSGGEAYALEDSLYAASDRLEESVPLIEAHKEREEIRDAVSQCARFMSQMLAHFPDIARKHGWEKR